MLDAIVVSIPHTGTRFLKERLGIEHHVHTHKSWEIICKEIAGKRLVSPLRHPLNVWKSWAKRHRVTRFPYIGFAASWYLMHTLDMLYEIDFIDLEVKTDPRIKNWSRVGDDDVEVTVEDTLPPGDFNQLYKLPFVQRFYYA